MTLVSLNKNEILLVEIQSFFWSVFSRIWTEYRNIRTRENFLFGHFSFSEPYSNHDGSLTLAQTFMF